MKIFISYGHNDHTPLVNALYDALRKAGHEPWKDDRYDEYHREDVFSSGVHAGADFTQVIYNAIRNSDFVIAFVTPRTQASPYCCDERTYAYNTKGRRLIQLRLEGVEIRLGNSGSYIDMDAVEDRDGRINQQLLEEKLQAIYAAFRNPDFLQAGPNAKFERHLRIRGAMPYEDFITMPELDDFVGRQWLLEQCSRWILDDTYTNRVFVLLGEAGTGKTSFVRHLSAHKELVRSVHVCIFDRPKTRNIKDTLKNLAYILTQTNQRYRDFLRNRSFDDLDDLDYDGLFEFLFVEPLKNEQDRYLLIIDGLDELEDSTGLRPLVKVLRQYAQELSPRVSILITTRPEASILSKLRTINPRIEAQSIQLNKENGRDDLHQFIRRNLQSLGCHSDALEQQIFDACDGNFEYLTLLFKEAAEEGLELTNHALPQGLEERYTQYLDRRMENNGQDEALTRMQHTLLSVLSVAYEPIPISLLTAITGYDEYDVQQELNVFGSLIRHTRLPGQDQLISFFSKGFRDYLLAGRSQYRVNAALGTGAIAAHLMKACRSEDTLKKIPYLDKHGFVHLLLHLRKDQEGVTEYINCMIQADEDKTAIRIALALCAGEDGTVEAFMDAMTEQQPAVVSRLRDFRAQQTLMSIVAWYQANEHPAYAYSLHADVLLMEPTPQAIQEATKLYKQALQIHEQNYNEHPDCQSRHNLCFSYNRLGNLALQMKTPEYLRQAENWFKKQLALAEINAQENPGYESKYELYITYDRLGDLALQMNTPEGFEQAEDWFRKQLALAEVNAQENPGYESRRDLIIVYLNFGDLSLKKNTPEGFSQAEDWFKKVLALAEINAQENPCYRSRRYLSISYVRLGDLSLQKNTPEGFQQAEDWFKKQLALTEINFQENPGYESRRDLCSSYARLGDLSFQKNTPEGFLQAEDWFKKQLALAEINFQENPGYESRRDLYVTYFQLTRLAYQRQDYTSASSRLKTTLLLIDENSRINPCAEIQSDLDDIHEFLQHLPQS